MTTTTTPPGATAPTLEALEKINPLIHAHGDPVIVIAALSFLAKMFYGADADELAELNREDAWGLSAILRACTAALTAMSERGEA